MIKNQKIKTRLNKGFSMVEMLVVLGIIGIMTVVVVFQYQRFNGLIFLNNTAYELATTIQQSQVFGLAHRSVSGSGVGTKNRYGVYVNTEIDDRHYILFIDRVWDLNDEFPNQTCDGKDGDGSCFPCVPGDECFEKSNRMIRSVYIQSICVSLDNNPLEGNGDCTGNSTDAATVTFQRPNPDALVYDVTNENDDLSSVAFILSNNVGNRRAVVVRSTGQISVQNLPDL